AVACGWPRRLRRRLPRAGVCRRGPPPPPPLFSPRFFFSSSSPLPTPPGGLERKPGGGGLTFNCPRLYFRCRVTSKRTLEEITHEPGNRFGHRRDRVHRRGNGRGVPGARAPRAGAGPPGGRPVEATPGTGG